MIKVGQLARHAELDEPDDWTMEVKGVYPEHGTVIVWDLDGGGTDTWNIAELEFQPND